MTNQSPKDFQALREKHLRKKFIPYCYQCGTEYPCDVITVLDAWEASLICDHTTIENGVERRWWFYCPKCNQTL